MLFSPPPGHNTPAINNQTLQGLSMPGAQGLSAQGYLGNLFRSSYAAPSSYAMPSTVSNPQQFYGPPPPVTQMARALRG